MNILFSERGSILFFYIIFLISTITAGIGGFSKRNLNSFLGKVFIILSFFILLVPLGFRKVGIDHEIYQEWYDNADYWLVSNYHLTPEPLFACVTLFAKKVLNNFQFVYFLAALVYLGGIYTFLERNESLGFLSVFFYNISIYLYMCGLARISFALGVLAIGYTHVNNTKKYMFYVLLATLFHYTSIVSLLVIFSYKSKKRFSIKSVIFLVMGMYILSYLINHYYDNLPYAIARYANYVQFAFSFRNISSCAILIPAIIIWFLFSREYALLYEEKYLAYDNIVKSIIVLVFLSMAFNGTFRLTFYFYPFIAKIYFDFSKVLQKDNAGMLRFYYPAIFTIVGLVYVYAAFFTSPFITPLIIPFGM